jgi:CcmD family protein
VTLTAAAATRAKVHVAGSVDHASLQARKLGGESSYAFDLRDHDGNVLPVVAAGSPPFGFTRTEIVVVEGRWRDGAFRAAAVLIPGSNRGLLGVMVITLIVWLGLFAYVYSVDRRLRGLERS